jgi:PIN domain nuclease of toxin-antitoxin system
LNLLLDTHIWYWLASDIGRLGKRVRDQLTNPTNEIWISPISTWEIGLLNAKGRIRISGELGSWVGRASRGTREAPITHEIAQLAAGFSMHRDPADRFLVATSQILDLTLVTADEKLLGLGSIRSLANR